MPRLVLQMKNLNQMFILNRSLPPSYIAVLILQASPVCESSCLAKLRKHQILQYLVQFGRCAVCVLAKEA